ncbi:ABC-type multidrug transport system, ATPase component [Paenimyroides aquimaris]|uniref:ABC-type multidrug transport system, ATPase component n=1 Tax=Paenimyroides marinum TaxID=1159016 RepID=A0A1H6J5P9_9FLAO|nr:ATP-binding cassette domain-containing protein [Paenimyroides aquimaris]SEH57241.1 ABC-type multidrug transport system, ATPase component [Paenimyroides aquimaris]
MKNVLEVDSIQKYVNKNFSLSDIYLRCGTGDVLGIFGRNGSGKSMLLKIIFGKENADNKFIRINNQLFKTAYKKPDTIVYLPQNSFLPKNLSVKKILNLYFDRETVAAILEDEFLETMYLSKISELSGGELRYLELKLLLKSTAKFVLLDEPLNALLPILREKIIRLIAIEKASKGIIITDHDFSNLSSITTQNYLMNNGTLKKITGVEDLVLWNYLPTSYTL